MQTHKISDDVIQKVTAALNVAISLASIHAKPMRDQIMEAANALDDATNAVADGETEDDHAD